jgi:hypothetical protein
LPAWSKHSTNFADQVSAVEGMQDNEPFIRQVIKLPGKPPRYHLLNIRSSFRYGSRLWPRTLLPVHSVGGW